MQYIIKNFWPAIIVAILIALFSTVLPAQGGFQKSNPSSLSGAYVVAHHDSGTTGIWADSFTVGTNLSVTHFPDSAVVASSTGTDATLLPVDATNAGLMLPEDKVKLDSLGIANGLYNTANNNTPIEVDSVIQNGKIDWFQTGTAGVANDMQNYRLTVTGEDDTALRFNYGMDDDAGNQTDFARVEVIATNAANGAEHGRHRTQVARSGTLQTVADYNMDTGNASIGNTLMATTISAMNNTQRNALTATAGMMIYSTTDTEYQFYNGSGWVGIDDPAGSTIDGSGTTNTIAKFSDSNTLANSNISDDGSKTTVTTAADQAGLVVTNSVYDAKMVVREQFGSGKAAIVLENDPDNNSVAIELNASAEQLDFIAGSAQPYTGSGAVMMTLNTTVLDLNTVALQLASVTAADASALTPVNGMIVYVNSTNGTFTSAGFWMYEEGAWVKM